MNAGALCARQAIESPPEPPAPFVFEHKMFGAAAGVDADVSKQCLGVLRRHPAAPSPFVCCDVMSHAKHPAAQVRFLASSAQMPEELQEGLLDDLLDIAEASTDVEQVARHWIAQLGEQCGRNAPGCLLPAALLRAIQYSIYRQI